MKYYPQLLLEECENTIKKNKMENLINDDLDLRSSDNKSDNESDNDKNEDCLFFKLYRFNNVYG